MTCLTTGPVTCRVRLDRGGYVPGEAINIWATIDNQSKVTIKGTRSCLTEVGYTRFISLMLKFISQEQKYLHSTAVILAECESAQVFVDTVQHTDILQAHGATI